MKIYLILSVLIINIIIIPAVRMVHVFVYGSLKKGQPNHPELLNSDNGQAEFITCARTVDKYPLVIAGKYNIPFLLNVPGSGHRVYGEIYMVDQKMLEYLDWFEKCPDLYQRTSIQLEILKENEESGGVEEAFVYSTTTYEPDWLQKPTYESYDTNGDHGLKFVPREERKGDLLVDLGLYH
ncbi:gamma-glutamylaminecyclotransferase C-like [Danio aesculapii]|uniref:gamma-glutamylaminecyclotransferase C-like n=1 Tax=Danio aesculapii TaxID=1142201 RepID=UPI0024C02ED9|nr:gamma-glutamylaminecyclotransferase C-like [Danio aesculapii]